MKKKEKLLGLSGDDKEALRVLAARPEYDSLKRLFAIEERNIIVATFKVNSSDPDLKRKKAHAEGRIFELRKIVKTFDESLKGEDD